MTGIVVGVVGLLAVFSWIVAVIAAIQVVRLAPKGERMRTYGRLGWWQFAQIRADLGEAVSPHITAYQRAVAAFLFLVIAGIAVGMFLATQAPAA